MVKQNYKNYDEGQGNNESEKNKTRRVTFSNSVLVREEEVMTSLLTSPVAEEDHEDIIEHDFFNIKDDVLFQVGDSNDIINRYQKLVKKLRAETNEQVTKNIQVKQLGVSSASDQGFATPFSNS